MTPTEEAVVAALASHMDMAFSGELTVSDVICLVRLSNPNAKLAGIYNAVEEYGPIGELDVEWLSPGVPASRSYTPWR